MIRGLGTDVAEVARLADLARTHGSRFLLRCFRADDRARRNDRTGGSDPLLLAKSWAAKEAFLKALGGPIGHLPYQDVSVVGGPGEPAGLRLYGLAAAVFEERGLRRCQLSFSGDGRRVAAVVILED